MHTMQIQKMKTKTIWRQSSACIWVYLGLLKPSSSGAYCGQTLDQNHKIIIIMRLVNSRAYDANPKNWRPKQPEDRAQLSFEPIWAFWNPLVPEPIAAKLSIKTIKLSLYRRYRRYNTVFFFLLLYLSELHQGLAPVCRRARLDPAQQTGRGLQGEEILRQLDAKGIWGRTHHCVIENSEKEKKNIYPHQLPDRVYDNTH